MSWNAVRLTDLESAAIQRSMLCCTSSTLKLSPLLHFTSWRRLKVQVVRSSDGLQLSARYGWVMLSASTQVRYSSELRNRFEASIQVISIGSWISWIAQAKRRLPPWRAGVASAAWASLPSKAEPRKVLALATVTPNSAAVRRNWRRLISALLTCTHRSLMAGCGGAPSRVVKSFISLSGTCEYAFLLNRKGQWQAQQRRSTNRCETGRRTRRNEVRRRAMG